MSEPRPGPPPDDARHPPPADLLPDALSLDNDVEPTDDSPTIVSKNVPRPPAVPEEALLGGLRGRRLAHFELLEPIGVGGMAAVIRARDTQLDRCVALKILPPDMAQDAENIRRFHQEARSAAKLDHENIARVFFCGEDRRLHFIAFEFVEGENLRTILERRGRLPVGEALHYILQVAAGLAHASRRGVVHRDIKPSNIIITPNGRAKLVDMGLARSLEPQNDHGLTQSGVTLGTFDYISPEQALEPRDADVRSDIYSLGCTFYHALTGHAPVPEGTAAKKLHHHQHVRPPDPRQFVPDLPDEVAVVLDRMMAKQVKDRYQSPDQLVHHLLLVARKLGAAPEVPEGVLSVEAALPSPPGGRPLLLTALAALAVIGLVVALDPTAPTATPTTSEAKRPTPSADTVAPKASAHPGVAVAPPTVGVKPPPDPPLAVPVTEKPVVYDTEEVSEPLWKWLQSNANAPAITILVGQHGLDVSTPTDESGKPLKGVEPGLLLKAPRVTIRAKPGLEQRPTIRMAYTGAIQNTLWAALAIESEQARVEGVRFVVDGTEASVELAALWLRGGKKHEVRNCDFIQVRPSYDKERRIASVVLDAGAGPTTPTLDLVGCCFAGFGGMAKDPPSVLTRADQGGQDAVVRRGTATIHATNCAFGPHAAVFRFLDGQKGEAVVQHCSVLIAGPSAVFVLGEKAAVTLKVEASLFARAGETPADGPADRLAAVLIQQTGVEGEVRYTGGDNRYYLDGYWVRREGASDWKTFQGWTADKGVASTDRELTAAPWKDPRPLVQLEKQQFAAAFHPDLMTRLLWLSTAPGKLDHLAGVEHLGAMNYLALPKPGEFRPERQPLVVEQGVNDSSNRIYGTLAEAVAAAWPGDVILIKHHGELPVDRVVLTKYTTDLTIRPERGYRPVLTLANPEDGKADVALFELHGGKLQLERLQFLLKPGDPKYTAQTLVALAGNGQCVLKDCVLTLDRGGRSTRLALATVLELDPKKMMPDKMPARSLDVGPRLELKGCLVRGDGDLVCARAGRPFEVEAVNTMAVLTGSLLHAETGWGGAFTGSQKILVRLDKVTTYLMGHLLKLGVGKGKGLPPVQCKASDCLFGTPPEAAGAMSGGRTLVHFDGPGAVKDKLQWVGNHNAYGAFGYLLKQQSADDGEGMMSVLPLSATEWKTFTGDSDSRYAVAAPFASPSTVGTFPQALPTQVKLADDLDGFGADPGKVAAPTTPASSEP